MPRTFSTLMMDEINKQFGGEPMLVVDISWSGSTFRSYTDRKLNGLENPEPRIISVGQFNTTIVVGNGTDTQQVDIVMDDSDGALRTLIDENDVHLRPVRLSLTFQGLPATEKALMFEGLINSPLVWSEPERTLSFTVISKKEETEAGFTMEDGDFPYVPPSERNKAWPLVFGQVCNMEAVQVTALRKGFLAQGVGVPDPTINERLCQAQHLLCPDLAEEVTETLNLPTCYNRDHLGHYHPACYEDVEQTKTVYKIDQACITRRAIEICNILQEQENQNQYVVNPFIVRGGEDFPQGVQITIKIDEVKFEGVMTGESFLVSKTLHPALDTIDNPECTATPPAGYGWRREYDYENPPTNIEECNIGGTTFVETIQGGGAVSWEYYDSFEKGDFIWLPAGTEVRLENESDLIYIVSLVPGTIDQVAAYRTYGDTSLLTELPTDLYTIHLEDFGGYTTVEIWLDRPLSSIEDADWDDTIYVSFTSGTGPNPVSIIEYLIGKYTNYTIDATSFASVGTYLTNYPSNFFVKSRPNVMDLIKDIAYQARCAVFIRDNIVYITYLSLEPTSLKTLTETDILHNSFKFDHTLTENLETKHTISWSEGEAGVNKDDPVDFDFVLKHNVPKYGNFDAEYDYYTYNIYELVEKSATFWMIRKANTWRYVEFETPMKHLDLDVFDCVTLDIAQFPTTKIVIEEATYNADSNTIKFRAWTPIRSGESTPYYWAWPSQQAATAIFPLVDEQQESSGDGTGIVVIPPTDHPLYGGYDPDVEYPATDGDKFPSDLDDSLPSLVCKLATGSEVADDIEPSVEIQEPIAKELMRESMKANEDRTIRGAAGGGEDNKEENSACGEPSWEQNACEYEVTVLYVLPDTVTTVRPTGSNCNSGGPCAVADNGIPCTGLLYSMCHSFGALFAAQFFKNSKDAEATALHDNCGYSSGTPAIYSCGGIKAIPCNDCVFGDCEDPNERGDSNAPGADVGQIRRPTPTDPTQDCPGDSNGDGATGIYADQPFA